LKNKNCANSGKDKQKAKEAGFCFVVLIG
jgi:hypothetical protein